MSRGRQAESAMITLGPGIYLANSLAAVVYAMLHEFALDLAIDLAAAASVVHCHQHVDDYTHSREKARCDPIIGWVANAQVLHLVWQCQQTEGADDLLAPAEQQTIPAQSSSDARD
jgi:hypothetical protein